MKHLIGALIVTAACVTANAVMVTAKTVTPPRVPDRTLTPGVVNPTINGNNVCTTKWGLDRRHVTEAMKREVAESYGLKRASVVAYGKGPCCEFDHLISRELGGADDVKNLFPQAWTAAKQKDRLENRLHALVCSGQITLADAQHAIAADWVAAFEKYVPPARVAHP